MFRDGLAQFPLSASVCDGRVVYPEAPHLHWSEEFEEMQCYVTSAGVCMLPALCKTWSF